MFLNKMFEAIGIPMSVRNIMVDYCDHKDNSYYKPLQSVAPLNFERSDKELVEYIKEEIKQQYGPDFSVCCISEVMGDFEMKELEEIFLGKDFGKHPMRFLYVNVDKAKEQYKLLERFKAMKARDPRFEPKLQEIMKARNCSRKIAEFVLMDQEERKGNS